MATSRIGELAAIIETNTMQIDGYLAETGLPSLSFDPGSPAGVLLDEKVMASRQAILDATDELHALMQGPTDILTRQPFNFLVSLQAITKFGLASSFPVGSDKTTFADIAEARGLSEVHVRRLLRHAMAFRVFHEPSEGVVCHTAASKALADTPLLRQYIGMVSEELWPAATKTVEALAKWPGSEEPHNAGFNIAHNTDATLFGEIAKYPDRDQRYADAMTYFSNGPGLEHHHMVRGYDWAEIGEGIIVDIGGSLGSLSIAIARDFPLLRFIVQDRPEVISLGRGSLPSDLQARVEFMEHDFFREQPIKDADIYILRWILHDWSDMYAARILQRLIPALKLGAKILVLEQMLPAPGEISKYQEKAYRSMDLAMWALHNAKERDLGDWQALLSIAHPGYKITWVTKPNGSRLSIIEIIWDPQRTSSALPDETTTVC